MACSTVEIPRPNRWTVPFSPDISEHDVEWLLNSSPFSRLNQSRFRAPVTLRAILKNDSRLLCCQRGDVIVEEGDWGNSAFFVIDGSVRVDVSGSGQALRQSSQKAHGTPAQWWRSIAQLWRNSSHSESRGAASYATGQREIVDHDEPSRLCLQDVPAVLNTHRTVTIGPGELFGELAALGRIRRAATVFADHPAVLLELRWQGLRDILRRDESLRAHLDDLFRERALASFLRQCRLFQGLSVEQLEALSHEAELRTYGTYDRAGSLKRLASAGARREFAGEPVMAQEGTEPDGVFLIRSGLARVSENVHRGHRTVGYLSAGRSFALQQVANRCLVEDPLKLQQSLRAIGFVTAVVIPATAVARYVAHDVLRTIASKDTPSQHPAATHAPRIRANSADRPRGSERTDDDLLAFLVANRVHNGTATMVIDLDRCTRCDDCVRACAVAHDNNPRFVRNGPVHQHLMVANACMQCEDPVCMIECPTGAIYRRQNDGLVSINDPACIGCSACAKNCPYEAIQMVQIKDSQGNPIREQETNAAVQKATKCDMCVDQLGGPACQNACPHDALARIDMREVHHLEDWLCR